jgi:hypothetical protein
MRAYQDLVFTTAARLTGNAAQAEDIAQHIIVARCLSAGRTPFMADKPPHVEDSEDEERAEDAAALAIYACPDDVHEAHQELVNALVNLTECMDDEPLFEYKQGTHATLSAEVEAEVEAYDVSASRPEFLAQALVDDDKACRKAEECRLMNEAFDDPTPAWVEEHDNRIRPAAFAHLAHEIAKDYNVGLTISDRALGVLYDSAMRFLDGLFDASAAQVEKRKGDELTLQDLQAAIPEDLGRCMRGRRTRRRTK